MSLKIAAALAATVTLGALTATSAQASPALVGFHGDYAPGTIVVKTNERRLYLVLDQGQAVRYPVGVGKAGKQWAGVTTIDGKYRQPAWAPRRTSSATTRTSRMSSKAVRPPTRWASRR
jgi:lipoprotein-anchoring transpeptidase ErfK/SrfK